MDNLERWEKMLNSVGTSPKIWRVFKEMKREIEQDNEVKERYAKEIVKCRVALNKIATRKMSMYLSVSHMNQDFIKIANEALDKCKE